MALVSCPDCQRQVSSEAPACPGCGRPINVQPTTTTTTNVRHCPFCNSNSVAKGRGLQGAGEVFTAIILILVGIIPGVIYYIYKDSQPYCSGCGRRV